jgi:hypothetical protein
MELRKKEAQVALNLVISLIKNGELQNMSADDLAVVTGAIAGAIAAGRDAIDKTVDFYSPLLVAVGQCIKQHEFGVPAPYSTAWNAVVQAFAEIMEVPS